MTTTRIAATRIAATVASRIAGVSLGLVVAGVVLGQTGTALADTALAGTATTPAAYAQVMYSGDADPGTDAPPLPAADPVAVDPVADPGAGTGTPAPAQDLTLTGSTNAVVVSGAVSCTRLADDSYVWEAATEVDGAPLTITFATNHYRGAATYRATGVTDEEGGLMTSVTDTVSVATNGLSTGTFTVDAGETTGSVDADLDDAATDQHVHVSGTWTCA